VLFRKPRVANRVIATCHDIETPANSSADTASYKVDVEQCVDDNHYVETSKSLTDNSVDATTTTTMDGFSDIDDDPSLTVLPTRVTDYGTELAERQEQICPTTSIVCFCISLVCLVTTFAAHLYD
jgi:hypothetical protein